MIASEVIEDVHQQYAAFLQAQLVREAVASAASEVNAYHRETAPIRAMARELHKPEQTPYGSTAIRGDIHGEAMESIEHFVVRK